MNIYPFLRGLSHTCNIRVASNGHRVKSDFTSFHIDESFVAPCLTPLVLANPEQAAVVLVMSPTYHLDSVTSDHLSSHMRVGTILVRCEVFVD